MNDNGIIIFPKEKGAPSGKRPPPWNGVRKTREEILAVIAEWRANHDRLRANFEPLEKVFGSNSGMPFYEDMWGVFVDYTKALQLVIGDHSEQLEYVFAETTFFRSSDCEINGEWFDGSLEVDGQKFTYETPEGLADAIIFMYGIESEVMANTEVGNPN